jgi:hypothetical protein
MKKTLVYGAATAVVALSLGSCAVTSCTQMSTLYGPPPVQDDEPIEDVYGAPVDFDDDTDIDEAEPAQPEDDEGAIITLYGPPPTDMD